MARKAKQEMTEFERESLKLLREIRDEQRRMASPPMRFVPQPYPVYPQYPYSPYPVWQYAPWGQYTTSTVTLQGNLTGGAGGALVTNQQNLQASSCIPIQDALNQGYTFLTSGHSQS